MNTLPYLPDKPAVAPRPDDEKSGRSTSDINTLPDRIGAEAWIIWPQFNCSVQIPALIKDRNDRAGERAVPEPGDGVDAVPPDVHG
jgi:hypothetical protein